jgi:CBS domain-containing protein
MWVRDYMFTKNLYTISPEKSIKEAVKKMVEKKTNSLVVVDKDRKPIGILSSYLLTKALVPSYLKDDPVYSQYGAEGTFDKYGKIIKDKKVKEIMHEKVHTLDENDAMIEAASYSIETERRILPVVNKEGVLIGAITRTCLKNALYNTIFKKNKINPLNGGCSSCNKS